MTERMRFEEKEMEVCAGCADLFWGPGVKYPVCQRGVGEDCHRLPEVGAKVVSIFTTTGNDPVSVEYKMRELYEAAESVFLLPKYEAVLSYLNGGPVPELPVWLEKTPDTGYTVGKMHSIRGDYVLIVTDGGREIVVAEDEVAVLFRTATRDASEEAARKVLEHLHQHTIDEICVLVFEDGQRISDADIVPEDIM